MARAMKDSGIKWIGEIPEGWEDRKVKNIYRLRGESGHPDEQVLSLYRDLGIVIKAERDDNFNRTSENTDNYKYVEVEDLVVNKMKAWQGSIATSNYQGIVSPAYYVFKLYDKKTNPFFIHYLLRCSVYLPEYRRLSGGIRPGQWDLSVDNFKNIMIVLPSKDDQKIIVNYLDRKCMLIDSAIEKQKLVIEKLKLYKQSVITEAVTKGLDTTVRMKPSGIKWIGEIPEGWKVGQLKFFGTIRSGITLGKKYSPGTELVKYPYLRVANVQGGYTDLTDVATILITEEEAQKHKLQVGEVLMTEGGDRDKLGRGCIWHGEIENCLHQNHVFAVRTDENKLDAKFFDYITTSDVGRNYFDFTAKKTTNLASTNSTTILEFRFPVPHIEAQKEIISYLDTKCSQIDAIIIGKQKLIDKLTDYKKSLIYECVTGKREVV